MFDLLLPIVVVVNFGYEWLLIGHMCSIGRVCYLALVIALLQYRPNISVDCGCTLFYVIVVI